MGKDTNDKWLATDVVKEMIKDGHLVGNHSYTHQYFSDPEAEAALEDFNKMQDKLEGLGVNAKYARIPGKSIWRTPDITYPQKSAVGDILYKAGYTVFGWDVEWERDKETGFICIDTPEQVRDKVVRVCKGERTRKEGNVLLMHDVQFRTSKKQRHNLNEFLKLMKKSKDPQITFERMDKY